jgi:hypothetical protein
MAERADQVCDPEAINHHVRAVCSFSCWMAQSRRIGSNPLDALALSNDAEDVRRARRKLEAEELHRLFVMTRQSS